MSRKGTSWRRRAYARIAARDGALCVACGVLETWTYRKGGVSSGDDSDVGLHQLVNRCTNLEVEHQIPLHAGGTNDDANLRLMCGPCHRAKTSSEQSARLKALGAGRNPR